MYIPLLWYAMSQPSKSKGRPGKIQYNNAVNIGQLQWIVAFSNWNNPIHKKGKKIPSVGIRSVHVV